MVANRHKNYFLHRERQWEEVPWLRPSELWGHKLPRPIVLINGAFDLVHRTHMRLIFAARQKAVTLICALDTDEKVAADKGPERPILNFMERAGTLNYLPLDYIVPISSKKDMAIVIAALKPDLRVQGIEYRDVPSAFSVPKMFVRGGSLHTTALIQRILDKYEKAQSK